MYTIVRVMSENKVGFENHLNLLICSKYCKCCFSKASISSEIYFLYCSSFSRSCDCFLGGGGFGMFLANSMAF
jgi:hypothetical protein